MACRSLIAVFAFFLAGPAAATTIDFTRLAATDWAATSPLPGVTLEAGAEVGGRVQTGGAEVRHNRFGGLGIKGHDDSGDPWSGTDQLDSYGANDVLILRFDRLVRLSRITFTMTDYFDRFDLYLGPGLERQRTFKADDMRGSGWTSSIWLGTDYVSDTFAIGAAEYQACGYDINKGQACWTENSAFKISGITFSDVSEFDPIEPVPIPSSLALFVSAFLGAGWWKNRQNSVS